MDITKLIEKINARIEFLTDRAEPGEYVAGKLSAYTDVLFFIAELDEQTAPTLPPAMEWESEL